MRVRRKFGRINLVEVRNKWFPCCQRAFMERLRDLAGVSLLRAFVLAISLLLLFL
jgi:hypothetical protein